MIRKHFKVKRFVLGLALGIVLAALAVPSALAKPVGSDVVNGGFDPLVYNLVQQSKQPVDVGPLDPWAYNLVHKTVATPSVQVAKTSSGTGFDFGSAGIGAAVSFGAAVVLLGSVGLGMRHRRDQRSSLATS